jgi:hypothetical protein
MKNIEFAAVCLYWYLSIVVSLAADLLAVLALLFMIHKLVSWTLWVISL